MQVTYYGHSCVGVTVDNTKLLFDPFISPNPLAGSIDLNAIEADYIFVSHGHRDHVADLPAIAQRTGAKIVCVYEVGGWVRRQGYDNVHEMNVGGARNFGFGRVKLTHAIHSSSMPDGSYGGVPVGFVVEAADRVFYFAGDTALSADMQLIGEQFKLDFAFLPIGGNFTMDADDAVHAAHYLTCDKIVGIHYDTFELIKINREHAHRVFQLAGKELILMNIGDTRTF